MNVRLLVMVTLVSCGLVHCQNTPLLQSNSSPRTPADILKRAGVPLSSIQLRHALANSTDYVVRMAAAQMLVTLRIPGVESELVLAATKEHNIMARINIAGALGAIDKPKGQQLLESICFDSDQKVQFRIAAVRSSSYFAPAACNDVLAEIITSSKEERDKVSAIEALGTSLSTRSATDQEQSALKRAADDYSPLTRLQVIYAIGTASSSNPDLSASITRSRLEKETDETLLSAIRANLGAARKTQ